MIVSIDVVDHKTLNGPNPSGVMAIVPSSNPLHVIFTNESKLNVGNGFIDTVS